MERRGDGGGGGLGSRLYNRASNVYRHTRYMRTTVLDLLMTVCGGGGGGEKELLLELVHVRFFGRREFVYKRVKETKGGRRIRGGEGGISRPSCLPWVPVLGFAFSCSTVLVNTRCFLALYLFARTRRDENEELCCWITCAEHVLHTVYSV